MTIPMLYIEIHAEISKNAYGMHMFKTLIAYCFGKYTIHKMSINSLLSKICLTVVHHSVIHTINLSSFAAVQSALLM